MNERIKELRKKLDLNQTEFGAKIGLSQRAIAAMEQGGTVTARNFDAICQAWRVNPEWLRNGVGKIFIETREAMIQSVAEEFGLEDDETALIRTFLTLTPEQRAGVMAFITNFAANMHVQRQESVKQDSDKTREEFHAELDAELDARDSACKRGIPTLFPSTGTSGSSKKIGRSP